VGLQKDLPELKQPLPLTAFPFEPLRRETTITQAAALTCVDCPMRREVVRCGKQVPAR
jgi:hypothetical protein